MAESDLERRVAYLERGVRLALGRARRAAVAIERTRGAVLVRLPRSGQGGGAGGGVVVPCCSGRQLPASVNMRAPDGVVTALAWDGARWVGSRTLNGQSVEFRYLCGAVGGLNVWSLVGVPGYFTSNTPDSPGTCNPLNTSHRITLIGLGLPFAAGESFLVYE